jgi:hypothetical protein
MLDISKQYKGTSALVNVLIQFIIIMKYHWIISVNAEKYFLKFSSSS